MRLESIVELPPKTTVATKRKRTKGNMLEKRRETRLKSNPKGVVRTNWDDHDRNVESGCSSVVEEKTAGVVSTPDY